MSAGNQGLQQDQQHEHRGLERAQQPVRAAARAPASLARFGAELRQERARGAPGLGLDHRVAGTWHGACAMEGRALLLRRAREVLLRKRSWSKSHAALLASRAAEMRACPSPPEALLWAGLVNRKLDGVAFRRQVPLAGYICDLVAASHRLVVEVDGRQHERRVAADARRDRKLERLGYRVLRIPAQVVMRDLPAVLALVREALRSS